MMWIGIVLLPLRLILATLFTALLVGLASPLNLLPRNKALFWRLIVLKVWAYGNRLIFGFWVSVHNQPTASQLKGGVLIIGNHVSYWDAFTVASVILKTFVAKAEVRDIPLIGFGAKLTGLLFVERGHMGSRVAMLQTVTDALLRREKVMIFPEGTTESEPVLLPFNVGGFKAAIDAAAESEMIHVLPVAISYRNFKGHAWGNEDGLKHFLRSASMLFHRSAVVFGDPVTVHGIDARSLCDQTRAHCEKLFAEACRITGP